MAMNQRVQKILLELMRERHSLYAGFTDVEPKSILKSHAGDVSACHATIQGLQDADGDGRRRRALPPRLEPGDGRGDGRRPRRAADAAGFLGPGPTPRARPAPSTAARSATGPTAPRRTRAASLKKKRHRPSRSLERIERRVPLTREGVDSLDWNEACEYAKSMGVSKKSHTTRDAYRDACRSWFDGRERAVFRTAPHEGYSSDEADDHPRPPRVVAADTIEPSSDEDDDEADVTPPPTDAHTDEQRDIARLMVAGVAGGWP
ncbi:hypothetical protein JL721_2724 [Aureococcus anophagefferens]|nr:hypothetical protein JL721_2724 [Aureococcus anophagefferens]